MKQFRFRPSYSNVVATLALFFALAGGAWAATQLPKESVGSRQLKNGAVTPGKLSAEAKKGFTGARGETGPQGALGPRGNEGPRGENGAQGATGPQGVQGATGATGATGLRGEPGEIGLTGEQGPQGDEGPEGKQGDEGPEGKQGDEGPEGKQGDEGPEGKQGEPGERGPSDAYVDTSEAAAFEIVNGAPRVPLELALPAGEYILQAALTIQGSDSSGGSATAECRFQPGGPTMTVGSSRGFLATVSGESYASLVGTTTVVVTEEEPTVFLFCEALEKETTILIPPATGHLTATIVGKLHP